MSLHPSAEDAVDGVVLLLQVTRFACGSFVVGTAAQHAVGDGVALRSLGGGGVGADSIGPS